MAQGYATLDDHGTYIPYTLVTKIVKDGETVPLPDRPSKQAVTRRPPTPPPRCWRTW